MPRDISSSEDEADDHAAKSPVKKKVPDKTTTRYQCPADFVSLCHKPCSSTLMESLKSDQNELWLIKAPANFNPECFSGVRVPLSGFQSLKVPTAAGEAKTGSGQQIYSVLASSHGTSELRLLTSDEQSSDGVVFGPSFSGLINVCESYGDSSANRAPQVIPAAPAPSIPPGLKQRFQPFGSKTPTTTCVAESEVDGATSSKTHRPPVAKRFIDETGQEEEEEEEGRKKKKKKKKEKQIKTEPEEAVRVKEEPAAEIQHEATTGPPLQQDGASEEKRKKKKKKKDREREEVEEGAEPSASVKVEEAAVKCEPIDTSYDDVEEGLGKKKKKKKKKSKTDDD